MRTLKFFALFQVGVLFALAQTQPSVAQAQQTLNQGVEAVPNDRRVPCSMNGTTMIDQGAPVQKKQNELENIVAGRNTSSISVFNNTKLVMREIFMPGRTIAKNLCPGGLIHFYVDRSFFAKSKPRTFQLNAVDVAGGRYTSDPIGFDKSVGIVWDIGEHDAERPLTASEQKVVEYAIRAGLDPDLALQQVRAEQEYGIAATKAGFGPGVGYGMPGILPCVGSGIGARVASVASGVPVTPCIPMGVGGAVWGGGGPYVGGYNPYARNIGGVRVNVGVSAGVSVGLGKGQYYRGRYNPYYGGRYGYGCSPGQGYIQGVHGTTFFAPGNWPTCRQMGY